jgi:BlaI family transcriptional regulator, penicillinase repressor
MARRKTKTLTALELAIMQILWHKGEATVPDIQEALALEGQPLAGPSVRTMLAILQDKGYATRRQDGRGFVYNPAVEKGEADRRILKDILDRAFKGSAAGLVVALVNARMVSQNDLDRAKQLIEEREKGGR